MIQRRQHVVCRRGFALSGDTFGYMGSIPPVISDDSAPRRSQRVMLNVSVVVLARGADNKAVSEETRTVNVNAHGAMILLGLKVSIGQSLMLRNFENGRRSIVSGGLSQPLSIGEKRSRRRIYKAFSRFWRISFPPADWTTRSPEAKDSTNRPSGPRAGSKKK